MINLLLEIVYTMKEGYYLYDFKMYPGSWK